MMADAIYNYICNNPGITAYGLAKAFKVSYIKIQDELAYLVNVCEDDAGHLFDVDTAWRLYEEGKAV